MNVISFVDYIYAIKDFHNLLLLNGRLIIMKSTMLKHKRYLMFRDIEYKYTPYGSEESKTDIYTITGMGKKAIKFQLNHGEDQFAYWDSYDFFKVARIILKSFENECWNKSIIQKIEAQKHYCKQTQSPYVMDDGFCTFCNGQMYQKVDLEWCRTEWLSGCRHCGHSHYD